MVTILYKDTIDDLLISAYGIEIFYSDLIIWPYYKEFCTA